MEDEKNKKNKKNKRKKKKNKDDTASSTAGDTSSVGGDLDDKPLLNPPPHHHHHHTVDNNGCASVNTDEKQRWLQEEARLRDMLKNLLYEKDSYMQRQSILELKMKQLQSENDSWHQKEVMLEQRISQLLQEKDTLSSEERNLQEKCQQVEDEKLFLAEKENVSKDEISNLNNENAKLKMQVLELEGARDSLSQENKVLLDNISTLQSRVQSLEMSLATAVSPADAIKDVFEKKNLDAEMEEAYALIGKLMTENADLVEKVNMLSMELGQRAAVPDATSVDIIDYSTSGPVSRSADDSQEDISMSTKNPNVTGPVSIGDEQMVTDDMDSDYASVIRHSTETTLSGEIVQISLDESESQDLEAQSSVIAGDESVPLTDAPLIGAPFRFISFVANYVSGADLVDKDSSNAMP